MKKLIIAYSFIGFLAQAQDLSWGLGGSWGLAGTTSDVDAYVLGKNQFYTARPYINYRIYKNMRVQLELPIFSLNSRFTTSDVVLTRYNYYNDYWDYYYDNCYVNTSFQRKKYYFSPSLLLDYRIKNLSLSIGAAFNIFDFGKGSEISFGSVDHWNQQWGYEPSYSDDVIISSTINNGYTYLPMISPIFGLSYHLNSLEFGYRYTIGKHQISLGYGKLPPKLKRFEIESVKQKLYEKFKIYGVTNRCDFKTSRRWHVGQRDLSSTRHQPADIF